MNREDIQKLVGGYATGTLTEAERKLLMEAALEDQELFDELAREQELKELLETPGVRGRLAASLTPSRAARPWWVRPWTWAGASAMAAAVAGALLLGPPAPVEIAQNQPPPAAEAVGDGSSPAAPQPAFRTRPVSKRPASPAVAPLSARAPQADEEGDRGKARQRVEARKEAAPAEPEQARNRGQVDAEQTRQQQERQAPQAASQFAQQAADSLTDQRRDQAAPRVGGVVGGIPAGAVAQPGQANRQQAQQGQQAPARAAAAPPAPRLAEKASARVALDYELAGGTLRVTPRSSGFLSVLVRSGGQSTSLPEGAVVGGVAATVGIPQGATSILLTFTTQSAATLAKSAVQASAPVVRSRSGSAEFPADSPDMVSVEIALP